MKKQTKLFLIIMMLAVLIIGIAQYILRNQTNLQPTLLKKNSTITNETVISSTETYKKGTINIDFGNGQKLTGQVYTQNPYQALVKVAKDNNMSVEVKQYEFGIMVDKIGNIANSKNSAWMYTVNDKPGQIAADRYLIYPGDKIDWKFTKF